VSRGKILITNVLSLLELKLCISSNLLTRRKIASGSSEFGDGICRNNYTITGQRYYNHPHDSQIYLQGAQYGSHLRTYHFVHLPVLSRRVVYFPCWHQSSAALASGATEVKAIHSSSHPRNKVVETHRSLTFKSPLEFQPCNSNTSTQGA
jgi:hypothetical protein